MHLSLRDTVPPDGVSHRALDAPGTHHGKTANPQGDGADDMENRPPVADFVGVPAWGARHSGFLDPVDDFAQSKKAGQSKNEPSDDDRCQLPLAGTARKSHVQLSACQWIKAHRNPDSGNGDQRHDKDQRNINPELSRSENLVEVNNLSSNFPVKLRHGFPFFQGISGDALIEAQNSGVFSGAIVPQRK